MWCSSCRGRLWYSLTSSCSREGTQDKLTTQDSFAIVAEFVKQHKVVIRDLYFIAFLYSMKAIVEACNNNSLPPGIAHLFFACPLVT